MGNKKLFLIYIPIPNKISNLIFEMNTIISKKYSNNSYSAFYNGKWQSHIMLYLSPMDMENKDSIIREIGLIAKELSLFKIVFGDFEKASGNYLFAGIDGDSKSVLVGLHNKIVKALVPFRDSIIKEKYLQRWDTYSLEEQQRIKEIGVPYEYVPHTSIATLSSEQEVLDATKLIKDRSLKNLEFQVKKIEIMISNVNDYQCKEIISSFDIR